jgi:hypothetical protein
VAVVPPKPPAPSPPPDPPPPPAVQLPRPEQVAEFVSRYDAGPCTLLVPAKVTSSSAEIEGYGADATPFTAFDAAFRKRFGWDAQVGVRLTRPTQCPGLAFVGKVRAKAPGGVALDIPSESLMSGQHLTGAVDSALPKVSLILVDDDGAVHDVTGQLKKEGDRHTFSFRLERPPNTPPNQPLLLIAMAGADVPALAGASARPGAKAFTAAADKDAGSGRLAIAMKYLMLQ